MKFKMKKETVRELVLIPLFCFTAIYLPLSLLYFSPRDFKDLVYPAAETTQNPMGLVGAHVARFSFWILGKSAYLLSFLTAVWSAVRFIRREIPGFVYKATGSAIAVVAVATLESLLSWNWMKNPVPPHFGGVVGAWTAGLMRDLFGLAAIPIALLVTALSAILATDILFYPYLRRGIDLVRQGKFRLPGIEPGGGPETAAPLPPIPQTAPLFPPPVPRMPQIAKAPQPAVPESNAPVAHETPEPPEEKSPRRRAAPVAPSGAAAAATSSEGYLLPPADLLDKAVPFAVSSQEQLVQERSTVLMKTLQQFGIEATVVQVDRGPVVTMYELMPAPGVKVHRIMALENDIAMALKATSIRIVAPIPGKSTVGIEVPNLTRGIVRLRELLAHAQRDQMIPLFLGKDTVGEPLLTDLTKMPHLLIAGATGSGKTVCLNTLILSILMTRKPTDVKLVLIDPKMVELTAYRDIPHLACPVVTDMKKAVNVLAWAVQEMDGRYDLLSRAGVRHIEGYNRLSPRDLAERLARDDPQAVYPERLPYLVIILDELADLMMVSANEIETSVIRLAQKSRSVGLHLILATQRPSVDVITGLIKSNLPARIAFQVASKVDSRTILDRNGADKLLGAGDLLFLAPGALKMTRGQGTFLSDEEIRRVVDHVKSQAEAQYEQDLVRIQEVDASVLGEKDELYEEAVRVILSSQRGSVSLIQRNFGIGYTRAARLIDMMAKEGLVGQYKGSQAREVRMTLEEWERAQQNKQTAAEP